MKQVIDDFGNVRFVETSEYEQYLIKNQEQTLKVLHDIKCDLINLIAVTNFEETDPVRAISMKKKYYLTKEMLQEGFSELYTD